MVRWAGGAIIFLGLSQPAFSQDMVVRDEIGRVIERIEPGVTQRTLDRRDMNGRRLGTVEDGCNGESVIRSQTGSRLGTVERGVGDEWIVRRPDGTRSEILRRDPFTGAYVRRDPSGRRLGTVEVK